jgi:DNA-binding NtrC family response regulator
MPAAERLLILAALDQFRGDKRKTAAALEISLNTLYTRLKEYKAPLTSGRPALSAWPACA